MTWHADRPEKSDGKLRHPSDAQQWRTFDSKHKEFRDEKRNIWFALNTNGMNPFGGRSSPHSTWPVLMTIYNLPPWLCHKRNFLLLTILIQGPKQPGIDIDVFLEPLMEEMEKFWKHGVEMWDEYKTETFTLKAIIFVTINGYPALFSLSGQKKGKIGYVVSLNGTIFVYLKGSKKTVYMGHRRWLIRTHKYHKMADSFDGKIEKDSFGPQLVTGRTIFEMCQKVNFKLGKKSKGDVDDNSKRERK
jgi:hypothetical protein